MQHEKGYKNINYPTRKAHNKQLYFCTYIIPNNFYNVNSAGVALQRVSKKYFIKFLKAYSRGEVIIILFWI